MSSRNGLLFGEILTRLYENSDHGDLSRARHAVMDNGCYLTVRSGILTKVTRDEEGLEVSAEPFDKSLQVMLEYLFTGWSYKLLEKGRHLKLAE